MKTWIIGITEQHLCDSDGTMREPEAFALDSVERITLANEDQELQDDLDLTLWFSDDDGGIVQTIHDCKIVDDSGFANAFREAHIKAVRLNKKEKWYQEAKS
jgi:hypothetical protein